jgi:hypothetical protein
MPPIMLLKGQNFHVSNHATLGARAAAQARAIGSSGRAMLESGQILRAASWAKYRTTHDKHEQHYYSHTITNTTSYKPRTAQYIGMVMLLGLIHKYHSLR